MNWTRKKLINIVLWLAFFNGLIASLISIKGVAATTLPTTFLPVVYLVLQQLGHFQFLAFLATVPLILISLIFPFRTLILTLAILFFSIFILVAYVNYEVFELYRFHLNGMVWNMLTGGAIDEIFVFDLENILTLSMLVIFVLSLQSVMIYLLIKRRQREKKISGWKIFAVVLTIQISGQSLYAYADTWYKTEIISQSRFIPLPQPITIKRFLRKHGWSPNIPEPEQFKLNAKGRFNYPKEPLSCSPTKENPNFLFIISDGLRFDMLTPEVMPVWSRLARKSQVFTHHMSTGNATRFGVYGLFSGLFSHYWFDSLNTNTGSVFIDHLKELDYQFGFFSNARLTSPEFDRALFSSVAEFIPPKTEGKDVISRELRITQQVKDFIRTKGEQPFFSFVFFDAPHAYVYPEQDARFQPALDSLNYFSLSNDSDPVPFLNRYKNSIHFNDRLSGEIFDTLEQQGLMDNTILILTGDHGQEANETRTNSWGHNSNFSRYQIQVPMVIYWPGKKAQTYHHLTSHVDIVPTLMKEVFKCKNPINSYSNGENLFNTTERDFVLVKNWNNQAVVNKNKIRVFPKLGTPETYDYENYELQKDDESGKTIGQKVLLAISSFYK